MSEEILDNIILIIITMIIGAVMVILGIALQLGILIVVGGFFVGGIPILKLVQVILAR